MNFNFNRLDFDYLNKDIQEIKLIYNVIVY